MIYRCTLLLGTFLLLGAAEMPSGPITLNPAQAEKEGRALVAEILAQKPAQNSTNVGVLKIRRPNNVRLEVPVQFKIIVTPTNWLSVYETVTSSNNVRLTVAHRENRQNQYTLSRSKSGHPTTSRDLSGSAAMIPFADSDFWLADLGLEFFQWPSQMLVRKEMKRSRSCKVLESVNPKAKLGEYARVLSWIDNESNGIIHAEAYGLDDKKIKEFDPKDFKKVDGQWQLQEMEIRNMPDNSSTRIEFNLGAK
ncbi:MAG: Outer rane lipoproteinsorting protein [Verrucomicrobiota bacterium]|jgi:hypothetical protein